MLGKWDFFFHFPVLKNAYLKINFWFSFLVYWSALLDCPINNVNHLSSNTSNRVIWVDPSWCCYLVPIMGRHQSGILKLFVHWQSPRLAESSNFFYFLWYFYIYNIYKRVKDTVISLHSPMIQSQQLSTHGLFCFIWTFIHRPLNDIEANSRPGNIS